MKDVVVKVYSQNELSPRMGSTMIQEAKAENLHTNIDRRSFELQAKSAGEYVNTHASVPARLLMRMMSNTITILFPPFRRILIGRQSLRQLSYNTKLPIGKGCNGINYVRFDT